MTGGTDAPRPAPDKDDELLDAGQEEVFSRAEVERGMIEHGSGGERPHQSPDERDEAQTERQAPDNASPGEAAG